MGSDTVPGLFDEGRCPQAAGWLPFLWMKVEATFYIKLCGKILIRIQGCICDDDFQIALFCMPTYGAIMQ